MAKSHVTDRDRGYAALRARIAKAAAGAHVNVGVLGPDASAPHKAEDGEKSSGITIGEIGEIHEFGLGNNPVRSWLRGYVDVNRTQIAAKIRKVAEGVEQGTLTVEKGLDLLGLSIVGGIQKRISAGIAPTVTAATQARKGPDKTTALINSGQFRSSIKHIVEGGA